MARDGAASRRAVRRVSSPDASRRLVRTGSPSQIAPSDGDARARRLVARRRGGALLTGLHTDLCTGARAKKTPHLALRARRAENKKAHTGVAVWAFTLSRYRVGGLIFERLRLLSLAPSERRVHGRGRGRCMGVDAWRGRHAPMSGFFGFVYPLRASRRYSACRCGSDPWGNLAAALRENYCSRVRRGC